MRSYRTISPLPAEAGGMSLWHLPSLRSAPSLAGTLPCGVRTFLSPARRWTSGHPARWQAKYIHLLILEHAFYTASLPSGAGLNVLRRCESRHLSGMRASPASEPVMRLACITVPNFRIALERTRAPEDVQTSAGG